MPAKASSFDASKPSWWDDGEAVPVEGYPLLSALNVVRAAHPRVDRADGVDGIGFGSRLVVAIADDAREAERHPAGVARRSLQAIERDLDDLLGPHLHDVPVGRAIGELEEAPCLPFEHRVGHSLERLAEHDEATAGGIACAEVDVGQLALAPSRAPLDGEH